jgi:hypothetical protein
MHADETSEVIEIPHAACVACVAMESGIHLQESRFSQNSSDSFQLASRNRARARIRCPNAPLRVYYERFSCEEPALTARLIVSYRAR